MLGYLLNTLGSRKKRKGSKIYYCKGSKFKFEIAGQSAINETLLLITAQKQQYIISNHDLKYMKLVILFTEKKTHLNV